MGASRLRREFLRDTLRAWRASRLRSVAKALRSSLGCGRCRPAVAACLENRSKLVALRASRCMMTFLFGCSGAFVRAPPTQMHCSCSGQASACINARVLGYGVVVGGLNVRAHPLRAGTPCDSFASPGKDRALTSKPAMVFPSRPIQLLFRYLSHGALT